MLERLKAWRGLGLLMPVKSFSQYRPTEGQYAIFLARARGEAQSGPIGTQSRFGDEHNDGEVEIFLPDMVRLEALATWTRMTGRATLAVDEAIEVANLEASTRVEAILTDGAERCEKICGKEKGKVRGDAEVRSRTAAWCGNLGKTRRMEKNRRRVGGDPEQLAVTGTTDKITSRANKQAEQSTGIHSHHRNSGPSVSCAGTRGRKNDAPRHQIHFEVMRSGEFGYLNTLLNTSMNRLEAGKLGSFSLPHSVLAWHLTRLKARFQTLDLCGYMRR